MHPRTGESTARLRIVRDDERLDATSGWLTDAGLHGVNPADFVLFRSTAGLTLLPGEETLDVWSPRRVRATRRAPGAVLPERIETRPAGTPSLFTLTSHRLIVHGRDTPGAQAHIGLERLSLVRADHGRRGSRIALEVLLHTRSASAVSSRRLKRRRGLASAAATVCSP